MNVAKTKAMIMTGRKFQERATRPMEHQDLSSKEYQTMKVCCDKCKTMVGRNYLKRHQGTQKCIWERTKIQNYRREKAN